MTSDSLRNQIILNLVNSYWRDSSHNALTSANDLFVKDSADIIALKSENLVNFSGIKQSYELRYSAGHYPYKHLAGLTIQTFMYTLLSNINTFIKENPTHSASNITSTDMFHIWLCFTGLVVQTNRYIFRTFVIDPINTANGSAKSDYIPSDLFMDYSLKTQYDRLMDANTSLWYLDFSHTNPSGEPTHYIYDNNAFGSKDIDDQDSTETSFTDARIRAQFDSSWTPPPDAGGNRKYFFDINILLCPIGEAPLNVASDDGSIAQYLDLFRTFENYDGTGIHARPMKHELLITAMAEMSSKINKMILEERVNPDLTNAYTGNNDNRVKMPHTLTEFAAINNARLNSEFEGEICYLTTLTDHDSDGVANNFLPHDPAIGIGVAPTLGIFIDKFSSSHSDGEAVYTDFEKHMSRETYDFHVQQQSDDPCSNIEDTSGIPIGGIFKDGFLNSIVEGEIERESTTNPFGDRVQSIRNNYLLLNARDDSFPDEDTVGFKDSTADYQYVGDVPEAIRSLRIALALGLNADRIHGFDLDALDNSALILTNTNRFALTEWDYEPTETQYTLSYLLKAIFIGTFEPHVNEIYDEFLVNALSNIEDSQNLIFNLMYSLYNMFDTERTTNQLDLAPPEGTQWQNVNIEFLINGTASGEPIDVTGALEDEQDIDDNFSPSEANFSYYMMIMMRLYVGSEVSGEPEKSVTNFIRQFMRQTNEPIQDLENLLSPDVDLEMNTPLKIKAVTQILLAWDRMAKDVPRLKIGQTYSLHPNLSNKITPDILKQVYDMMVNSDNNYAIVQPNDKALLGVNMVYDYFRTRAITQNDDIPIEYTPVFRFFKGEYDSLAIDEADLRYAIEIATRILEDAVSDVVDGNVFDAESLSVDPASVPSDDHNDYSLDLDNNINEASRPQQDWVGGISQMLDAFFADGRGSLLVNPSFQTVILDNIKHMGVESVENREELSIDKKLKLLSIYRGFLSDNSDELVPSASNGGNFVRFINYLPVLRDTIVRDVYKVESVSGDAGDAGDAVWTGDQYAEISGLNYGSSLYIFNHLDLDIGGLKRFNAYFDYSSLNGDQRLEMWLNHMYFLKLLARFTKKDGEATWTGEPKLFNTYVGRIGSVTFLNQMKTLINKLWGSVVDPTETDVAVTSGFWLSQHLSVYLSTLYTGNSGWNDDTPDTIWQKAVVDGDRQALANTIVDANTNEHLTRYFPGRTDINDNDLQGSTYNNDNFWRDTKELKLSGAESIKSLLHDISLLNKDIYSADSLLFNEASDPAETALNFFKTDDTDENSIDSGVKGTMIEYVMLGLNTRNITDGWYQQFRNTSFTDLPFPLQLVQLYANYKMYIESNNVYNIYDEDGKFIGNPSRAQGQEIEGDDLNTYEINVDTFDEFVVYLFFAPRNRPGAVDAADDEFFNNVNMLTDLNVDEYKKQFPNISMQKQITLLRKFMKPAIKTRNKNRWSDNAFEETMSDIRFKLTGLETPVNNAIVLSVNNNLLSGPISYNDDDGTFNDDIVVSNGTLNPNNLMTYNLTNINVTKYNESSISNTFLNNYFSGTFDLITLINSIFISDRNRVFDLTTTNYTEFLKHLQRLDEGLEPGDSIDDDDAAVQFVKLNEPDIGTTILNRPVSEILSRIVSDVNNKIQAVPEMLPDGPSIMSIFESALLVVANSLTDNVLAQDQATEDALLTYAYRRLFGFRESDKSGVSNTEEVQTLFLDVVKQIIRNDGKEARPGTPVAGETGIRILKILEDTGEIRRFEFSNSKKEDDLDDALSALIYSHYYNTTGTNASALTQNDIQTAIERIKSIIISLTFFTRKYFDDLNLINAINLHDWNTAPNVALTQHEEIKREIVQRIMHRLFRTTNTELENKNLRELDDALLSGEPGSLNAQIADVISTNRLSDYLTWSDLAGDDSEFIFNRIFAAMSAITTIPWSEYIDNAQYLYLHNVNAENSRELIPGDVKLGICGGSVLMSNLINMEGANQTIYNQPNIYKLALHMVLEYLGGSQDELSGSQDEIRDHIGSFMPLVNTKYTDLSTNNGRDVRDAICNSDSDKKLILEVLFSFYRHYLNLTKIDGVGLSDGVGGVGMEQILPLYDDTNTDEDYTEAREKPGYPILGSTEFGSIERPLKKIYGKQQAFQFNYSPMFRSMLISTDN